MATGTVQVEMAYALADASFYDGYRWCLNPMLSVRDLLQHLGDETERYRASGAQGWQGEERRINLYLFTCAIACTLDDHLAARPWSLAPLVKRLPVVSPAARLTETVLNAPHSAHNYSASRRLAAWRRQWTGCVDAACELLLSGGGSQFFDRVRPLLLSASSALGEEGQRQRMRIPEAFRCQDLTHHDVLAMVRLCLPSLADKDRPILIVGPRTAGAYFGPLAAVYLRSLGYASVQWITIRPKNGFSRAEAGAITRSLRSGARVLIIDDHPNSGHTLRLLLNALGKLGADPRETVVALPGHPSIAGFALPDQVARGVRMHLLPPEDRYKVQVLAAQPSRESQDVAARNADFVAHYSDSFQVRVKRIIVTLDGRRLMAKSAGWGWLGYHAALAATALDGFVPRPLYLREGILYSEFVEGEPLSADHDPARTAIAVASYVARRVERLGLHEDPAFAGPAYRWCGWDDLIAQLSRVYGPQIGLLKKRAIRHRLAQYVAPRPTLVDGRMCPADWLSSDGRLVKTDFEHHNFGGGESDIVDPAWDLVSAIYEFRLPPRAEESMLRSYIAQSGDNTVEKRLPFYKILYATSALRAAKYWLARRPDDERRDEWNRQFTASRSFAAFHVARYCGKKLDSPPASWEPRLFFLDLDGVLDWGLLGFPHTSRCGIQALQILQRGKYAVVLNTARSLEHVREYCRAYNLPGGAGELGSVFYDAVRDWEVPLVDAESFTQMETLRAELRRMPGIFVDPENRYSIRAYRFHDGLMRPLAPAEIADAMRRLHCTRLVAVGSSADTYIIQEGLGKGPAIATVQAYLGCSGQPVVAMGDSRQDLDMLQAASTAFAPANASKEVRLLAASGSVRITSRPLQAGLLEAAIELCPAVERPAPAHSGESLLDDLLAVVDRRPMERFSNALQRREL